MHRSAIAELCSPMQSRGFSHARVATIALSTWTATGNRFMRAHFLFKHQQSYLVCAVLAKVEFSK